MNITKTVESLQNYAEKLGYDVYTHRAQTGTVYLTCERDGDSLVIRVADHAELYAKRGVKQISVSPEEGTLAYAKTMLEHPEKVHPYIPDETLVRDQNRMDSRWFEQMAAKKKKIKSLGTELRENLPIPLLKEWGNTRKDRPACKILARQYGYSCPVLWHALTGRYWEKQAR